MYEIGNSEIQQTNKLHIFIYIYGERERQTERKRKTERARERTSNTNVGNKSTRLMFFLHGKMVCLQTRSLCNKESSTVHVPSDTSRTWKWSPNPRDTCSFDHLQDLEGVAHPHKYCSYRNDMHISINIDIHIVVNMNIENQIGYYIILIPY